MMTFFKTHSLKIILPLLILLPTSTFIQTFGHKFVWDDEFLLAHGKFFGEVNRKNIAHFWIKPYNELYVPVAMTAILLINQIPFPANSDKEKSAINLSEFEERRKIEKAFYLGKHVLNPKLLHLANLIFHIFNLKMF